MAQQKVNYKDLDGLFAILFLPYFIFRWTGMCIIMINGSLNSKLKKYHYFQDEENES